MLEIPDSRTTKCCVNYCLNQQKMTKIHISYSQGCIFCRYSPPPGGGEFFQDSQKNPSPGLFFLLYDSKIWGSFSRGRGGNFSRFWQNIHPCIGYLVWEEYWMLEVLIKMRFRKCLQKFLYNASYLVAVDSCFVWCHTIVYNVIHFIVYIRSFCEIYYQ